MTTDLGIKPDSKKVYIYRLYSLITDGGGIVYRKVFTEYATQMSGSVSDHLEKYHNAIRQSFLQGVINRVQYDRLFPNRHPASSVKEFDLTLLAFLVRITCAEETVDEDLRRRVAKLDKLRTFRNEIVHIHSTEEYDETKFEQFWEKIRSELLQLGTDIPRLREEIDLLKYAPIDPRRENELQEIINYLQRKVECAEELTDRINQLELNQKAQFECLHNEQKQTKNVVENIRETQERNQLALVEQLLQITKNPFLQLPSPGDFAGYNGMDVSLRVSQTPTSLHYENKHEYTRKDERSGFKSVTTYQQKVTKGTVDALEHQDYEDISNNIGSDWVSLADHLGISESQIKKIKTSFAHDDIPAIISEVIRIWGEIENENATIHRLIQAILECPMMNVEASAFEDLIKRHK